jgi:hypothetical protein
MGYILVLARKLLHCPPVAWAASVAANGGCPVSDEKFTRGPKPVRK